MTENKHERKPEIDIDTVAVPEIHICGKAKEEIVKEGEPEPEIDYSGAVPEYHPRKETGR